MLSGTRLFDANQRHKLIGPLNFEGSGTQSRQQAKISDTVEDRALDATDSPESDANIVDALIMIAG